MGFGRIGRNLFCILYKRDDIQVSGAIPTVIERLGQFV
jgi:glyceraldehyde-3-phosphate dehydrogenase/erythrose-4-phosphate dehydrogenase